MQTRTNILNTTNAEMFTESLLFQSLTLKQFRTVRPKKKKKSKTNSYLKKTSSFPSQKVHTLRNLVMMSMSL